MRRLGIFPLAAPTLASGIALLVLSSRLSFAQGSNDVVSPGAPAGVEDTIPPAPRKKPMQEERQNEPSFDPVSERIKYLHDRLRITAAQEPLWDNVAQVMRDNADAVAPLIKERVQNAQHGNALDILNSYKKLGDAQLDGLDKFIDAFRALYEQLSDQQKKIADSVFRLGPLGMVGGIPQLAEQLVSPPITTAYPGIQAYPAYPTYSVYPTYPYYPFYAYSYVPTYSPWIWGPPFAPGAPFFFVHRHFLHHHQGFQHPAPGGVPRSRVGVMHHR